MSGPEASKETPVESAPVEGPDAAVLVSRVPVGAKVTVTAPSNIAFLKYWGAIDLGDALPENVSLSMTLSECVTRTTIERLPEGEPMRVELIDASGALAAADAAFSAKVQAHLTAMCDELDLAAGAPALRIATVNNFPSSAGIASSASGFAALAVAFTALIGRSSSPEELSILARRSGSGSASRSVMGGYVEWPGRADDPRSAARQVAPAEHWELHDVIAVVSAEAKGVSSRQGHERAASSPHFARRQEDLPGRLERMRSALLARDLGSLGELVEAEAVELHLVAMSSAPPIFYWRPATLEVLARVRALRAEGVPVWSTMDAGPNVHMICEVAEADRVAAAVGGLPGVERLIHDRVGSGPRRSEEHLF